MRKIKSIIVFVGLVYFFSFLFFPTTASGNTITNKIQLNGESYTKQRLFDDQLLSPSNKITSKEVEIKNTEATKMKIYQKYFFSLFQKGFTDKELDQMLENYLVKPQLTLNGVVKEVKGLTDSWKNPREFNAIFMSENGKEMATLQPGDTLSIKLEVALSEHAGNEYQGATFTIDLFTGTNLLQPEKGFQLPKTATSSFNLILIGLLLAGLGTLFYFLSIRGPKDAWR